MLCMHIQRSEVVQVLGSREEPPASVLESTLDQQASIITLDDDLQQDHPSTALITSFHDLYSSTEDSDMESDEDNGQQMDQQMSPSPDAPDVSFLSMLELQASADQSALDREQTMEVLQSLHSQELMEPPPGPSVLEQLPWNGYCIFGDNIDKTIRPRHQTVSRQTKSLHMFQSFAQFDRMNLAAASDEPPEPKAVDPNLLMPSLPELQSLMSRFAVMISRYVMSYAMCMHVYIYVN